MDLVSPALAASCFSASYVVSRGRFLLAAAEAGASTHTYVHPDARTPDGGTLSTDVAVIGPDDAERAALIVSGTHGPEGFVGAAAQIALLREVAAGGQPPGVALVLVHGINPWGFAQLSRTTENNVDLNRNFIDWSEPPPANAHYAELHAFMCPPNFADETIEQARASIDAWTQAHGFEAFSDATMRGQYTHPTGLNYGGTGREWSNLTLEAIVSTHLGRARKIALIDWHTGLGDIGEPFFLCFNPRDSAAWERACNWWGRDRVETRGGFGGAKRPSYTGLLFHGVQRFAAQAEVTGAVVEFGTQTRDEVRRALQLDVQLKFGDDDPSRDEESARETLLDAFSPQSIQWRRRVLAHSIEIQHSMLDGLRAW